MALDRHHPRVDPPRRRAPGHAPSRKRVWLAFVLELLPLAAASFVFTDVAALFFAYWASLWIAGLGWFALRDIVAGLVTLGVRLLTLPFVWFALYLSFAGFSCDGGLCDGNARVAAVTLITLASGTLPLLSSLVLAAKHFPRSYGGSEAIAA